MEKRYLDEIEVSRLIKKNFNSVSEFCKLANLSRSHFYGMMKRKISVGKNSEKKLYKALSGMIDDIEDILEPLPIIFGDKKIIEINVVNEDKEIIASISSRDEITDKKYRVEYIPYF